MAQVRIVCVCMMCVSVCLYLDVTALTVGILSSIGELAYSVTAEERAKAFAATGKLLGPGEREWEQFNEEKEIPDLSPWNVSDVVATPFPITHFQPKYFIAESLSDVKVSLRDYCEKMNKPFHVVYNEATRYSCCCVCSAEADDANAIPSCA